MATERYPTGARCSHLFGVRFTNLHKLSSWLTLLTHLELELKAGVETTVPALLAPVISGRLDLSWAPF